MEDMVIEEKNLINDIKEFEMILEKYHVLIKARDGVCEHCTWQNHCAESVLWCVKQRIKKMCHGIEKEMEVEFIRNASMKVIWERYVPDYLPCAFTVAEIIMEWDSIKNAYYSLEDLKSKNILIEMLMYRLTWDERYPTAVTCKEDQYFIDEYTALDNNEVVIDCGAYTGDTLAKYLEHNHIPKKYYLYESNPEYIEKIKKTVHALGADPYAVIRPFGVWARTTNLWFSPSKYGGSGGGYVSETQASNSIKVPVVCIDEDVIDTDEVTLIKMDIEGAEQSALEGASRIIEKSHPKLAICIYHKTEDMWQIINKLKSKYPFYNHYKLRHYKNHSNGDTVLYVYE